MVHPHRPIRFFIGGQHHFMVWGTERLSISSNAEHSMPQLHVLIGEVEAIIGHSVLSDPHLLSCNSAFRLSASQRASCV